MLSGELSEVRRTQRARTSGCGVATPSTFTSLDRADATADKWGESRPKDKAVASAATITPRRVASTDVIEHASVAYKLLTDASRPGNRRGRNEDGVSSRRRERPRRCGSAAERRQPPGVR